MVVDSSLGSYGMKKPPNISSSHPMKPPLSAGAVLACVVFRVLASRPFVRSVNGVPPGVLVLVLPRVVFEQGHPRVVRRREKFTRGGSL